ncbi:MAG: glycosyltransferase family 39 protein [Sphingomonadales bacterium]|nr:glycosyltransferase family 39 protein [Sphingomonadales bacterium]
MAESGLRYLLSPRADSEGGPMTRWELWALSVVLSGAAAVRIVALNAGLWYDEIFTLTQYVRAPLGQLLTDFSSLNNHMFYSLQAKAAVALLGESAWVLRLPAMLFGLASLVLVWVIGRGPAGRSAALFAALLLAISYHHVWFSQKRPRLYGPAVLDEPCDTVPCRRIEAPRLANLDRLWPVGRGRHVHAPFGGFLLCEPRACLWRGVACAQDDGARPLSRVARSPASLWLCAWRTADCPAVSAAF